MCTFATTWIPCYNDMQNFNPIPWGVSSPHMREPWSCAPLARLFLSFVLVPCRLPHRAIRRASLYDLEMIRNTFRRTRSLSNATFSFFDHVTFIQFKICCCVQNFTKIRWFFTEIWRYIDFQNGGRPPSWNCFNTIRDHPRSLCCWPQLPVKFHVKLIHRSGDTAIWNFRIGLFGLKCLFSRDLAANQKFPFESNFE